MANKWRSLESLNLDFLSEILLIASYKGTSTDCSLMVNCKGEVFAVGRSNVGCLGLGLSESTQPVKLEDLSDLSVAGVSVCGQYGDALAYTKEGMVFVWGENAMPDCCVRPVLLPQLSDVVEASCIQGHYLALTRNGKIYEWRGLKSCMSDKLNTTPTVVPVSGDVVSIACGLFHSFALTKNGDVYIWGKKYDCIDQPLTKVPFPGETIVKVACGCWYSLVLTHSGKIFTWGCNFSGLGNDKGSTLSHTPVQVGENIGRFKDIAVNGWSTSAAVTEAGAIYMWGMAENNSQMRIPALTQCTELQQVFVSVWPSKYTWRCNSSAVEPPNCDSIDVENSTSIEEKLKNTFNDKESSDLTLIIDSRPIYVHRFVLNLRSNYFQAMLQTHWMDKNERAVEFGDAFSEEKFKTGCEILMYKKNLTLEAMALLHSMTMTRKDIVSKVQSDQHLKGKVKKLEINIEKIQQKQERLEEDKHKLMKELEGLEEEIIKQQKERNEANEALLVKLEALRIQIFSIL